MARALTIVVFAIALLTCAAVLLLREAPRREPDPGSPRNGDVAPEARVGEAPDTARGTSGRTILSAEPVAAGAEVKPEALPRSALEIELRHAEDQQPIRGGVIAIDESSLAASTREALLPLNVWYRGLQILADSAGKARLDLPPGVMLQLRFAADTADVEAVTGEVGPLQPGETRPLLVQLARSARFTFYLRILDGDERAVAGARCVLLQHGEPLFEERSDSNGVARLAFGSAGSPYVGIWAEGYAPVFADVDVTHVSAAAPLIVRVSREVRLRGRLVDDRHDPVPAHRVVLAADADDLTQPRGDIVGQIEERWSATTDGDGRIELRGLPGGVALTVSVFREDRRILYREAACVAAAGAVTELEWQIGSLAALEGKVVDQHAQPVAGVSVALTALEPGAQPGPLRNGQQLPGSLRTSGPDGSFRMNDVPAGDWILGTVRAELVSSGFEVVHVTTGTPPSPVVLKLWRDLFIEGLLVDAERSPLAGVPIRASSLDGLLHIRVLTVAGGGFRVGPLSPGQHKIEAGDSYEGPYASAQPVVAEAGTRDLVIVAERAYGAVHVRLIDAATGQGVQGWVTLWRRDTPDAFGTKSRLDGEFTATGLPPGTWDLVATDYRGRIGGVRGIRIDVGGAVPRFEVGLQPAGFLLLSFPGASEATGYIVRSGSWVIWDDNLPGGKPVRMPVPPGDVTVVFRCGDRTLPEHQVHVAVGEVIEVVGRLPGER